MIDNRRQGLFWGVIVVGVGLVLLLDQMGVASAGYLFRFFWPAILLFFGIRTLSCKDGHRRFWGVLITLAGVLLLMEALGLAHVNFALIWPLVIIFGGAFMLMRALGTNPKWVGPMSAGWFPSAGGNDSGDSELNYSLIFSGVKRRITSKHFKGGKIVAVFGGFDLDLRKAEIEGDEAVIQADAVFGGGEIKVPDTWHVSVRAAAILGGFVDETQPPLQEGPGTKRLIVKGSAVFGGIAVKN
jgi:predicted membrane protein